MPGDLFLRLLKMMIVPLVVTSVIHSMYKKRQFCLPHFITLKENLRQKTNSCFDRYGFPGPKIQWQSWNDLFHVYYSDKHDGVCCRNISILYHQAR